MVTSHKLFFIDILRHNVMHFCLLTFFGTRWCRNKQLSSIETISRRLSSLHFLPIVKQFFLLLFSFFLVAVFRYVRNLSLLSMPIKLQKRHLCLSVSFNLLRNLFSLCNFFTYFIFECLKLCCLCLCHYFS